MPRNGSGTFTLAAGNPVVTGTVIDSTWANATLEDIANEITNSLSRNGEGGMLAPFRVADGSVSAPGLAFTTETNTGLYRAGTGEIWLAVGGVAVAQITGNGLLLPAGKRISLPAPVNDADAANKEYVDDQVAPVIGYADFYLGSKSSDPTTNNSGGALTQGTTYWSSTLQQMRVYNGINWVPMPTISSLVGQTFSGDGSDTTFTLANPTGNAINLEVFISGVRQVPTTDYSVSGTTLTFVAAPPTGTNNIFVRYAQLGTITDGADSIVYTPAIGSPTTIQARMREYEASGGSALIGYTPAGTGAVATTVQAKLRESVSVLNFGAVGNWNGATGADDTEAVQLAVNSAKSVLIPEGYRFRITDKVTVPNGVKIHGGGEIYIDQATYVRGLELSSNCEVDGVTFRGNGVASGVSGALPGGSKGLAISVLNASNVKIHMCRFYDFVATGLNMGAGVIAIFTANNVTVSNNYFDTTNYGFDDVAAGYYAGDCIFTENISYSNCDVFISVSSVGSAVMVGTSQVPVTANHVVTGNIHIKNRWQAPAAGQFLGRHGVLAHYDDGISYMTASNNVIGNVSRHGFYLRGPSTDPTALAGPNIVSNNFLMYCGSGEDSNYCSGIRVETTLPVNITNNYIYKSGYFPTGAEGTSPAYDIESVRGMKDVIIANNTCNGAKDGAINIATTVPDRVVRNVKVHGNTIYNTAFGVMLNVSGANCFVYDVSIARNMVYLLGATYAGRSAGIATEFISSTISTAYTLDISDNMIVGLGKTQNQYGICQYVSSASVTNKAIVRNNAIRNVQFAIAGYRFVAGTSYAAHRQIGTTVQWIGNKISDCGTAFVISKTAATILAVVDESNVYENCNTVNIATTIGYDSATAGRFIGRDASGNLLLEYKASAIPTAQQYYQGDRIINSAPAAGGYLGWVCVTSGTPGTWKGYGAIQA